MIFVKAITTPANTPSSSKIQTIIPLVAGTITLVAIQFPSGINALAHIALNRGLQQLFPTNQDADFATGGETIVWDENYPITTGPIQLEAYTWNDDDTYDHTITVRVVVEPIESQATLAEQIAQVLQGSAPAVEPNTNFPSVS